MEIAMSVKDDITNFIFLKSPLKKADIIFIPGNGRPEMMEYAAELWKRNMAPFLLPSGRFSITLEKFQGPECKEELYPGDYKTECEFLTEVAIRNGVLPKCILKEDQAGYTMQNAQFSRLATDQAVLKIDHAILCCKSYHMRRAYMYYQAAYPETEFQFAPVDIDGITPETWNLTKQGRELVAGELLRIGTQFEDLLPIS